MPSNKIEIQLGDITKFDGDAIVNAANQSLCGGGAVGQAKSTKGYLLAAKYIIHTVGPVWNGGDQGEADLLAACYRNSIRLADSLNIKTIAFPAIGCGAYRFPVPKAVEISWHTLSEEIPKTGITSVTLFLFDEKTRDQFWRVVRTHVGH